MHIYIIMGVWLTVLIKEVSLFKVPTLAGLTVHPQTTITYFTFFKTIQVTIKTTVTMIEYITDTANTPPIVATVPILV